MTISAYFTLFDYLIQKILEFPPTLLVFAVFFVMFAFRLFYKFLYGSY